MNPAAPTEVTLGNLGSLPLSSFQIDRAFRREHPYAHQMLKHVRPPDEQMALSEVAAWLRKKSARYDFILEDLSYPAEGGVTKPEVSYEVMPDLIRKALRPNGVALYNLLEVPGLSWRELYEKVTAPFETSRLITLDDWENRLVLVGSRLESAWKISRRLRHALRHLGSDQASAFTVRTLRM